MQNTPKGRRVRPVRRFSAPVALALAAGLSGVVAPLPVQANGWTSVAIEPAPMPAHAAPAGRGTWDGAYYGFSLGYNFHGRDRVQLAPPPPGDIGTLRVRGVTLGAQFGRNWQQGDTVTGIEAALNLTSTGDSLVSGPATARMRINPVADVRGRMGWSHGEGLFYAAAGLSAARVRYGASDGLTSNIAQTFTTLGYTVGLGYERMIEGNWSMRGEYSYTQYHGRNLTDGVHVTRATPDFHSLRFGLNRRF